MEIDTRGVVIVRFKNTASGRKRRRGEKRKMCNYQPRAEHMSAGLYWNRDEPRTDRFYNLI